MSPPDWPERPGNAQDFDEFWLVRGLPPEPFPADYDYGNDRARFGPPGTRWIFSTESLINRKDLPGTSQLIKLAIERMIRKLGAKLPPAGSMSWTTPLPEAPPADPVGAPMRWIRTTITADLANNETITHALNWRTSPQPDVDQDAQAMLAFATQIKTHWVNFLNNAAPGTGSAPKVHLSGDVKYREVTAAYLEQTVPATITTHPSRKTGHQVKDFTYPRPTYLVPTQFVQFDPNTGGTATGTALPYEVAMCISLKTGLRGPRNRGRLYLGGFTTDAMGGAGNFADIPVNTMLGGFRNFVNSMNVDTGNRLHIVSRAYATSIGVNAVTAGIVPDSQRRRRRSRDESYKTQFDT